MLIVDNAEERQRIGDTIRQARKNKKITQTQLGSEIGIGKVAVANYESGKIKVIPFEKRVKLASLLDIPLNALLYQKEVLNNIKGALELDHLGSKSELLKPLLLELQEDMNALFSNESQNEESFQEKWSKFEKDIAIVQKMIDKLNMEADK